MTLWWLLWSGCSREEAAMPSPGRVTAHRLNRVEYDNTVRDLFGTTQTPAADGFPADDFGVGFDNIADVLSLSPLHVELYDQAADKLLDELFGMGTLPVESFTLEAESPEVSHDGGNVWDVVAWVLWDEGGLQGQLRLPMEADYTVAVDAFGHQAGEEPPRMELLVDGVSLATFDVTAEELTARYEVRARLGPGMHTLRVEYVNEYKQPGPPEGNADRNLVVDRIQLLGPLEIPRTPSPSLSRVLICDPAELGEGPCAEQIARTVGRRILRRPLSELEVGEKMRHYGLVREAGGSFDEGVRALIKGLLLSPWFIYRLELDPYDGVRPLNGFELAQRLSYFLWSSTPDDHLLDVAQSGALLEPDVLEAEARRMLADPRADALIENLAGQWLGVRKVDEAAPSAELYPDWDSGLQSSMREEMARFVASVLRADRSALELFTTDETFVDARLAEHYGLPAPEGEGFSPVRVPERKGLLARGGLLAALSLPTRTSPVLRGNWVLGNLLCAPPPPAPPGVPALEEASTEPLSLRDQLELHRADPACASCHDQMDAIGLALESYDAIGRYRTVDELGLPIDASGELPGLGAFTGATDMQALLAADPRLPRCMVDKTLTYALGRGLTAEDGLVQQELAERFAAEGYRFEELLVEVVLSRPFRWRQGEAP
jgi:hypothetical protein